MQYIEKKNRGFTLLELLLVTMLLSVISLALYSTFNSGMKIWKRVSVAIPEEDVGIFFDKLNRDLKNSFEFKDLNFRGTRTELEFASLLYSPRLQKRTVGKVEYSYVASDTSIAREEKDLTHIFSEKHGIVLTALNDVKSMELRYYFYDKERDKYIWQDEWVREGLPLAVRMELKLEHNGNTKLFTKTVSIPASKKL